MKSFDAMLASYAEVTVNLGLNIQKGQVLVIDAPILSADFVRIVAEKAYDAGAKHVEVNWHDAFLGKTRLLRSSIEALSEYPSWRVESYMRMAQEGAAFLTVHAPQPKLLQDVPTERITASTRAARQALSEYQKMRQSFRVAWSIVNYPTLEWAEQVYPDAAPKERLERLWTAIFRMTRVDQNDPAATWQNHLHSLNTRIRHLNQVQYRRLRYQAPGTDLVVALPENHVWLGGGTTNEQGIFFVPNIPTEEVFTAPIRTGVNGTVRSTKPLFYNGKLIDDFSLRFENGRIVDYDAAVGYDVLQSIIETDEGSHYLGELALVPQSSPIAQEDTIFYNTGFDENASCHLAIGMAYPANISGGTTMSREALLERGVNTSLVHIDFMIGSSELDIDGETQDGEWVPVFRKGEWV
ncbi:aminopeptidase [Alicyclobacillus cycloheptanicus]|uniref:Aminopeptidase n=1 Tax=Alicyclobacillus cycloheptanicus TaxID=1457 RepID=A0ABT9XE02_9BACL|nr:aminopeptidase [Alicyclobacillus cycloheptanicus]MDQ0188531.1 aminopeptidase [Alicyclobacillus cycloheptanicus]WDM01216.1 aminopeptidase [Alicyclobacillus cycloheptanicus]